MRTSGSFERYQPVSTRVVITACTGAAGCEQRLQRAPGIDVHRDRGDRRHAVDLIELRRAPDRGADHVVDDAVLVGEHDAGAPGLAGLEDRDRRREAVHERDLAARAARTAPARPGRARATSPLGAVERANECVTQRNSRPGRRRHSERCLARVAEERVELVHHDRHARRFELARQIGGRAILAVAAGVARHVREPLEMACEGLPASTAACMRARGG